MVDIFIHVPKCAGGTVQNHVDYEYRDGVNLLLRPYFKDKAILKTMSDAERAEWNAGSPLKKNGYPPIFAPSVFPAVQKFAVSADIPPMDAPFSAAISSRDSLEMLKKMLADFYFVGLTEDSDDVNFTLNRLGVTKYLPDKNVLSKKKSYARPKDSAHARKLVAQKCPFDVELYEYALQLKNEMKARIPDYDSTASQTRLHRLAAGVK